MRKKGVGRVSREEGYREIDAALADPANRDVHSDVIADRLGYSRGVVWNRANGGRRWPEHLDPVSLGWLSDAIEKMKSGTAEDVKEAIRLVERVIEVVEAKISKRKTTVRKNAERDNVPLHPPSLRAESPDAE